MSQLLTDQSPFIDVTDLDPGRFARGFENRCAYGPGARA